MNVGALLQMVQQNDEKHDKCHGRLRDDFRDMESRLNALEGTQSAMSVRLSQTDARINQIGERRTDAGDLSYSSKTMIGIVSICVALAAGQWKLNSALEASVKAAIQENSKIQDERYQSTREWQAKSDREQQMQKYELQALKEMVIGYVKGGKK